MYIKCYIKMNTLSTYKVETIDQPNTYSYGWFLRLPNLNKPLQTGGESICLGFCRMTSLVSDPIQRRSFDTNQSVVSASACIKS